MEEQTAKAPIALGTLRQYREGWNDASNGALPTDCPYSDTVENVHLWINGLHDYFASPFNCEARRRYNAYRLTPKIAESELEGAEVITEDDFTITRIRYSDGSAIVITPTLLHVEAKNGHISATCERALFLPAATDTAFDREANRMMHGHDGTGDLSVTSPE